MNTHAKSIRRPVEVAVDASMIQLDDGDQERADAGACCGPTERASCCEPAAKADCCGPTTAGGCGCR
jgi:hypothetical protein